MSGKLYLKCLVEQLVDTGTGVLVTFIQTVGFVVASVLWIVALLCVVTFDGAVRTDRSGSAPRGRCTNSSTDSSYKYLQPSNA